MPPMKRPRRHESESRRVQKHSLRNNSAPGKVPNSTLRPQWPRDEKMRIAQNPWAGVVLEPFDRRRPGGIAIVMLRQPNSSVSGRVAMVFRGVERRGLSIPAIPDRIRYTGRPVVDGLNRSRIPRSEACVLRAPACCPPRASLVPCALLDMRKPEKSPVRRARRSIPGDLYPGQTMRFVRCSRPTDPP